MIEATSLWQLVERRAEASPDVLFALDEAGRQLSYGGLRESALRAAAGLHGLGIGPESPVSWLLPTRIQAFVLMAALARLGAVQNPLVPIYRQREARHCLRETGARWLLVPGHYGGFDYAAMATELAAELPGLSGHVLGEDLPDADPSGLPAWNDPPQPPPVRWIFYTSGTTASPKGARHGDDAVLLSSRGLARSLDLGIGDRTAVVFPVTHLGGANALTASLYSGSTQLVVEKFDPPTTIPFLARHGVTHAGAGTVFHRAYLAYQRSEGSESIFPKIRAFYGGGAPKTAELHHAMAREIGGVGILSAYGMTECPIVSLAAMTDPDEKRARSEGLPTTPETEIRLVAAMGGPPGPGEDGEIRIRAPQMMRGYVDAELNAEAFDADGFFRTGDLGRVDEGGYVRITGRLKDVIIRKGENISAPEVEELLLRHPKVADVAVVGLPDDERGERACAAVICRDPEAPLGFQEMVDFLGDQQLMRQKIPEQLEILDDFPRNPSGKVVKPQLRERLQKG